MTTSPKNVDFSDSGALVSSSPTQFHGEQDVDHTPRPCTLAKLLSAKDSLYLFLPLSPGDLVACRSLLAQLRARQRIVSVVRRQLYPLIADIVDATIDYDLPWQTDFSAESLRACLMDLDIPPGAALIDLICVPATWDLIDARNMRAIGHRISNENVLPYVETAPWTLGVPTGDRTHYSIRMLRILPEHRSATVWPSKVFEQARYPTDAADPLRVAVAPGCGRDGQAKRMPIAFWRTTASLLRQRGLKISWFLGPDEIELVEPLVSATDTVIDGNWNDVLAAHARTWLGIANDTCHMHIRAHQQRPTLALFRRPEIPEWGAYPSFVTCIDCSDFDVQSVVQQVRHWFERSMRMSGN